MLPFSDIYNFVQSLNVINSYNVIDYVDEKESVVDIEKHNTNGSIFYNPTSYIDKIYESFDNLDDNIWRQVNCDISRTHVYYNNIRIYTKDQLCKLVTTKLAMLTTQAAFFLPFYLLHGMFGDIDNNIYVMNDPLDRSVKINNNDVLLECTFKLLDTNNNIVLNYLNIKLFYGSNNIILWSKY